MAFTETKFQYGTIYELPHLDLNYGYGNNVQLKLEGPLTIFDGNPINGHSDNYATLGYTNWGVKWRFQEENKIARHFQPILRFCSWATSDSRASESSTLAPTSFCLSRC